MKKLHFLCFAIILLLPGCQEEPAPQQELQIIPAPFSMEPMPGRFKLQQNTKIFVEDSIFMFQNAIQAFAFPFSEKAKITEEHEKGVIHFRFRAMDKPEAYRINISRDECLLEAGDAAGAFYAVQTLNQIIAQSDSGAQAYELPACQVFDFPGFAYRGMHLDVCRHFFTVEEVKRYLDIMALHKFNRFHWHLTEDQGWRIEILKYPELTRVGSRRKETVIGRNSGEYDGKPHGGFYTREQIREVVEYAAERQITIIPEIEMPGHSRAALAAYSSLGCTGGPYEVATKWGVFSDVYCAGNDSTILFLKDVLDEVMALFPGEYIHIGGDECPKERWRECDKCQKRIAAQGLKNEHELQAWLIQEIEHYLNSKGRKIIGWDEIMEGGLAKNATVMSWRGEKGGIVAATNGHQVIMTPNDLCYFDHYQFKNTENQPLAIGGLTTLMDVYHYEPVPDTLKNTDAANYVLGAQANLWTEYIPSESHLQYMMLPRAAALSEVLWSAKKNRKYDDFLLRLESMKNIYEKKGWNYAVEL